MGDVLTYKQRRFVDAYMDCLNQTEAARRAKYAHPHVAGSRLLANVKVRAEIDRRFAAMGMGRAEAAYRITEQAKADIGDFWQLLSGNHDEAPEQSRLLKSVKIKPTAYGTTVEVAMVDSQAALFKLARILGLDRDDDEAGSDDEAEWWKAMESLNEDGVSDSRTDDDGV